MNQKFHSCVELYFVYCSIQVLKWYHFYLIKAKIFAKNFQIVENMIKILVNKPINSSDLNIISQKYTLNIKISNSVLAIASRNLYITANYHYLWYYKHKINSVFIKCYFFNYNFYLDNMMIVYLFLLGEKLIKHIYQF